MNFGLRDGGRDKNLILPYLAVHPLYCKESHCNINEMLKYFISNIEVIFVD